MRRARSHAQSVRPEAAWQSLERGPLAACVWLGGEEEFFVERALAILRRRHGAARASMHWRTVWGDDEAPRFQEALAGLSAGSLFAEPRGVVVRRAEALSAALEERIIALLPHLEAQRAVLVLVARTTDQRKRLAATVARQGALFLFPRISDAGRARAWIERMAKERGLAITPAAAELLVELVGTDLALLDSEVEKAALRAGAAGRIDVEMVQETTAGTAAGAVETLIERLDGHDVAGALRVLRRLLEAGEPPVRIAAFLAATVRRRLHVAELRERGLDEAQITQHLGMPPWLVRRHGSARHAAPFERTLDELRALDGALKSSRATAACFDASLLRIADFIAGQWPRGG